MKIELLYPDVADLFGERGTMDFLKKIFPKAEIISTKLIEKPKFLTQDINLVYMGPTSEQFQEKIIELWRPFKQNIKDKIENGVHFLFIGNAMEVLSSYILTDEGKKIEALDIFPFYAKRQMMNRINCEYIGSFGDLKVVGHKSQFTFAYPLNKNFPFLFNTIKGYGFNLKESGEGIHYKNFYGTYLIGPFLILNPKFTKIFIEDLGIKNPIIPFYDDMIDAYEYTLKRLFEEKSNVH